MALKIQAEGSPPLNLGNSNPIGLGTRAPTSGRGWRIGPIGCCNTSVSGR